MMQQHKKKYYVRKMYQTEKYQFNVIEPSDTFSPDPLNKNTQRLEEQLDAVRAEAAAGDTTLDQRLQAIEARHIEQGFYAGTGGDQIISLGYTPKMVMVPYGSSPLVVFPGTSAGASNVIYLRIVDGGFCVSSRLNILGGEFPYLAIE